MEEAVSVSTGGAAEGGAPAPTPAHAPAPAVALSISMESLMAMMHEVINTTLMPSMLAAARGAAEEAATATAAAASHAKPADPATAATAATAGLEVHKIASYFLPITLPTAPAPTAEEAAGLAAEHSSQSEGAFGDTSTDASEPTLAGSGVDLDSADLDAAELGDPSAGGAEAVHLELEEEARGVTAPEPVVARRRLTAVEEREAMIAEVVRQADEEAAAEAAEAAEAARGREERDEAQAEVHGQALEGEGQQVQEARRGQEEKQVRHGCWTTLDGPVMYRL